MPGTRRPAEGLWLQIGFNHMNVVINTGRELNWIVTLVMSIFFGYLGVDRFMMGHIGLGLLKLCTFGGFGVWWLVDMILIATRYQYKNVTWI